LQEMQLHWVLQKKSPFGIGIGHVRHLWEALVKCHSVSKILFFYFFI
jgi:hypothetical protein